MLVLMLGVIFLGCKKTLSNNYLGVCYGGEEGFEPSVRINVHTLSKRAPSATRTLFHGGFSSSGMSALY